MRRAIGRTLHVADPARLDFYRSLVANESPPKVDELNLAQRRLVHMLVASVASQHISGNHPLQNAIDLMWRHPQVLAELRELYPVLADTSDHVYGKLATHADVPLAIHGRYSRQEILAAFSDGKRLALPSWREGVRHLADERCDLLVITLDKSNGVFSPTTRYRDYAISPTLMHWESQSVTRENSATGVRYRTHEANSHAILLFARLRQDDRAFWFLGPGRYRGHVGERPMSITWELDSPLSADLYTAFAAAVA
jgi:hypothetical protein